MPSKKNKIPVVAGKTYHIFNRGNNCEQTFFSDGDYNDFLNSFKKYLSPFVDLFAYALIPNHFHLLLQVHEKTEFIFYREYQRFIQHYVNRANFIQNRSGSLFLNPYKRIIVEDEDYFKRLVFYIHYNPVKHNLTKNFRTYHYSSYSALMNDKNTGINRDFVFYIFGSKQYFMEYHTHLENLKSLKGLTLED